MSDLLLVGLDNPQTRDPRYALFSRPAGCSGNRLMLMMQMADSTFTEHEYIQIKKTNLFPVGAAPTSNKRAMQMAAALMVEQLKTFHGGKIVLVGGEVRHAFADVIRISARPMTWTTNDPASNPSDDPVAYAWIPHPSGRNRQLIDKASKVKVGRFLIDTLALCGRGVTITQRAKR